MNTTIILTLPQVADLLCVSPSTIYRLLKARRIPAFKISRDWRFRLDMLDDWMREMSVRIDPASIPEWGCLDHMGRTDNS